MRILSALTPLLTQGLFYSSFAFAKLNALLLRGGKEMTNKKLITLIKISILSAMAFVLYLIELPLPIFPAFLKIDLSDIPALLGAFAMGPIAGVIVELVKNVLHLMLKPDGMGVGELANFIVGSGLAVTAGFVYNRGKSRAHAVTGLLSGIVVMAIVACIGNYFLFLKLYELVLHFPMEAIIGMAKSVNGAIDTKLKLVIYSMLPFNLLKGFIVSIIVFLIYKRVSPILHK
jgi:riboflavin transporter